MTKSILLALFIAPIALMAQTNVGINTNNPAFDLDIRGTNDADDGGELQLATPNQTNFLRFFGGRLGDANPFMAFTDTDTFHIVTTSTSPDWSTYTRRMTIRPNGYVGIGTQSPEAQLDIRKVGDSSSLLRFQTDRPWVWRQYSSGPDTRLALQSEVNSKAFEIRAPAGKRIASFWVNDNFGRISLVPDTSGEVGIGVLDPTAKLQIAHNSTIPSPQLRLTEQGDDFARIKIENTLNPGSYWDIAGHSDTLHTGSHLNFFYGGPEGNGDRMTIRGDGNVGIGTTSPTAKLHVNGDIRVADLSGAGDRNVIVDANGKFKTGNIGAGGSDADWVETASYVYNNTHDIGIGTTSPGSRLHIIGPIGNAVSGSLKLTYPGTPPFHIDAHSMVLGGGNIDVVGTLNNTLNLQPNSVGGVKMVGGGGGVGIGGNPSANLKLSVTGARIANAGDPALSDATLSIWNTDGNISQMIIDANEISTVDEDLNLNQLSSKNVIMVKGGGKVGVNTANLASTMNIEGFDNNGTVASLQLVSSGGQKMLMDGNEIDVTGTGGALYLNYNSGLPVAIGTNTLASGYQLNVGGKIIGEEMRVQLEGSWPDYVFQEDYKLMSLEELSETIKNDGHLPGIPKASVIEQEGLELGDMQKRMMEKIEELTLHMINMNERVVALEKENATLKAQLERK